MIVARRTGNFIIAVCLLSLCGCSGDSGDAPATAPVKAPAPLTHEEVLGLDYPFDIINSLDSDNTDVVVQAARRAEKKYGSAEQ